MMKTALGIEKCNRILKGYGVWQAILVARSLE